MNLEQKRKLYMKEVKILREYNATDITSIDGRQICFFDGFLLDFAECKEFFPIEHPYGRKYIGGRMTNAFWQFFVKEGSIVILCDDVEGYLNILSNIGFTNSFEL